MEPEHRPRGAARRALHGIELLADVPAEERDAIARDCAWRRYRPGERLFGQGSRGQDVFFIVEGEVEVVRLSAAGREVRFATASAGATVGELACIDGPPRSASVIASDDALVAVLPGDRFIDLMERRGTVALRLLRRLSAIVRHDSARVVELSSLDGTKRVYAELLRLATSEPDGLWAIKPLPALRALAGQASTTREQVASALNALYPTGLIARRGDNLYITDRGSLERMLQERR